AAGLMCGSSPLPDDVTRSTGIGVRLSGSAARNASARAFTASTCAGLSGPRLEPEEAAALYSKGAVADGRLQKYLGSLNGWPISAEPATSVPRVTRLPRACRGKAIWATRVTSSG